MKYKEEQKFRHHSLVILILVLAVFCGARMIGILATGVQYRMLEFLQLLSVLLILKIYLVVLSKTSVTIKLKSKHIVVRRKGWQQDRLKLKWSDIKSFEPIRTPFFFPWYAGNITFASEKQITISGRNGFVLITNNGRRYFVGTLKLNKVTPFLRVLIAQKD